MLSLQIFLFGVPRIERNGETVFINRRKAMALLAYLAVTGQAHSRDTLATLFWPERDQSGARANLRRDLSRLKRALGEDVLLIDRLQAGVNPEAALWLDVAAFQKNVEKAQQHGHPPQALCPDCYTALVEAAALYSDDFMAGFSLPDSLEYEEWQFFQAESLRRSLAVALQQLIHWHVGQGEYEQGIEHGRRWLALDPLHEPAQRQLMRLYAWSGQQAAAMRQYQECVRLLDEELGVEPEEETKALYEAIKARQLAPPEPSAAPPEPLSGATPAPPPHERYVQEELLIVSGQGEVYRGLDRVTKQPVVIKRLRPDLVARRPELVARLVREGEALSQLNHPNIVQMLAVIEKDVDYALVMEYVAGGSLRQLLDAESQLPQAQALDIALELADALSRAHHLNIIHRDLKPDNVLLAADGTPRLTDFGMARLGGDEARLTQTGSFIGSPAYMSPEALHGEALDARSDIWSFGVLLYEMLAGRRPFAGTHITSVLVSILNDPVPELQQFRPEVPPPLVNLLQRMLVKERPQRLASMRQVAAELEAIRAGWAEGRTPQPTTLWTPSPMPSVAPTADRKLKQVIRFCHSADGVRLAYATVGEGPPLIKAANWLNHLEYDWQSPVWRHWLQGLAQHHRLIRYDERGCGLSDWDVANISFEAWVSDLEAVVDAAGVDRFPLLGISHGGPVAIAYALRHPERVSHLILYGAYSQGLYRRHFTEQQQKEAKMINDMIEIGWGRENPAYRQVFTSNFMPDGTAEHFRSFNELQRVSSSPENAVRIIDSFRAIDVSDLATRVSTPTLIIHARNDASVPFEEGRRLASLIAGAQFVPLESRNHILMESEPAWQQFLAEVHHFLGVEAANIGQQAARISRATPPPSRSQTTEGRRVESASNLHKLPLYPTPFIGREQELADITDTLTNAATRLLTIVGPGGIGKTRLALAIAERVAHTFSDGAWFVSLAPLQSAEHLVSTLANSLDFQFGGSGEPKAQLLRYLSRKRLLLVLDNFEHLLDGAELLMEIVATAADVKILTTSRERLNLSGEMVYALGGMTYPDWQRAIDTDVTAYSAVQLLLQRARLVRPDLKAEGQNLVHATRICQLVAGMPLALVLAAGWLEVLSLEEIADEIAQGVDFLETEMRDVPERQRSMRAVFESSWKRLAPQEQRSLAALSVFRGGFRREAAQTVAGAGLSTLRKLVNKSLISLNKEGRYEIHELLRQYAALQLQTSISDQEQAQSRHCAYYASFLQQRTEELKRARQKEAIDEITAELDNIRAAWRWAITQRNIQALGKAAESLYYFSDIQGAFHEGDALFDQAVVALTAEEALLDGARGDAAVAARQESLVGFLLVLQGWMRSERGRFGEAENLIAQGLSLIRQAGENSSTLPVRDQRYREAFALMHLGWVLFEQEESSEAKQRAQAALTLFSEVGDRWGELLCLLLLATIIEQDGDLVTAEQYAQACLAICREIGERREQAFALMVVARNALTWGHYDTAKDQLQQSFQISRELNDSTSKVKVLRDLGRLAIVQGDYRQAAATLQECLAILNEVGSTWLLGSVQNYLGTALRLQGDFDGATRCYQDSLAVSQRSGQQTEVASCLSGWGCLAYSQGEYQQAEKYQQEALAIWRQVSNEPEIASCRRYLGYIATAEGEHQWPQARQYFSQALQLALKHRLAPLALDVFAGVAELMAQAGEVLRAVELLALAEHHPASTHETREWARQRSGQLSAAMPALDVQTARARGRALDWREAAGSLITQLAHTGQELRSTAAPEPQVGQNLPAQTTPFIGREEELADIVNKLTEPDTRLLTLIGPGGIGKTRLSIQAAAELAAHHSHHFPHGVYFVPLAPLTEPEAIVPTLTKALDISLYAERTEPRQQILNYLRPQKMLLLLDNFEHLVEPASIALLNDILATAPGVKLLATSRERLNLQGERVLLLAGLATPEDDKITWSQYSALHLFRESARRARPDFELGSENLATVIRICRLVQGMPLGILLAAAWLELLGPDEIVAEIEQSFDFLESEWHDLPERQRSLRAVFDTSWKLLDEAEQAALSALTVFQGGFTRDAALAVVATSPKTLLRLVHKCWLEREANGRFQIHELLRQYAAEKLAADESHERQVRDQHAAYFAGQLQKWYGEMRGPNSAEAFVAAAADTANVQVAWRWLVARRQFDTIMQQMLPGFFRYCEIRIRAPLLVPLVEMTRDALAENESEQQKFLAILLTVQAAFNRGGVSIRFEVFDIILPMYKEALDQAWTIASERGLLPEMGVWSIVLAWLYGWTRNLEDGLRALTALLSHVRQLGDRWELAFAMQCLGHLQHKVLGWENAGQNLSEALHLFQETGDEHEIGFTQRLLGILRLMQQQSAEAKLHLQAAQTRLEDVGDLEVAAEVNWHLADVHFRLGEPDEAFRYLRALRQAHLNLGRTEAANRALSRESYEALRYGTIDRARETRRQTLALAREVDDTFSEAWYIWEMGEICRVAGEEEAARHWYDKAKGLFERVPDDNGVAFYHRGLGDLAHARGDYQEAQRQFKLSLELAQEMRHSWAESYAAAGLGRALLASGQPEAAREPLLTALQIARQTADTGLILLILARIADWCAATGRHEQAVTLVALVVNHHASWNETRAQAQAVLSDATAHLPGEQAAAAEKRGQRLNPGEMAVQLIEEFARPEVSHNLPTQPTPFVGRDQELAELRHLLLNDPTCRMLTLVGPGGIGKTRLALAAAAQLVSAFADGVYFVPLAPLESAGHIASALADSLDYQFRGSREPKEQLLDYLHHRRLLLVLDNFEHLLEGAGWVTEILEMAPGVKVLATSRERLNLSGELVYTLGGMSYPDWQRAAETDVTAYSAVQLLLQRARLVRPDLKAERHDLVHATHICQLVEGMPLALVLAAGWLELLSLEEIAEEIAQSLDFLETEMRDVPARHRSMRAVFESSWKQLAPDEQQAFMRLAVFRGGFTRQAAQHVAGAGLRTLRSLVNKSFITVGQEDRYEIHELLRQYGEEKLIAEGKAEATQDQHFRFYMALAAEAEPHLAGESAVAWLARLEAEHDNLRAALAWRLSGKGAIKATVGLKLARMLEQFWDFGGYYQEALTWLTRLLAQVEVAEPEAKTERAYGLLDARRFATTLGDFAAARAYGEEALTLFQRAKDDTGIALALADLAFLDVQQDNYTTAQSRLEEALLLARAGGDREVLRRALSDWGLLAWRQGDYAAAQSYLEEALMLARLKGNIDNIKILLYHLGNVAFYRGDFVNAETLHQESLALAQEVGDRVHIDWSLVTLGNLAFVQGDYEQTRAAYKDNLARLRELGSQQGQAMALLGAGKLAAHDGNFASARAYLTECLKLQQIMSSRLGVAETMEAFAYLNVVEAEADDTSKKSERLQQAAQLYGAADSLRAAIGAPLPPVFQPFHERSVAAICAGLGDVDFATTWERGKALDLDAAVADFLA